VPHRLKELLGAIQLPVFEAQPAGGVPESRKRSQHYSAWHVWIWRRAAARL